MTNDNEVLSVYLKEINKIPLLSHEEETELAIKAAAGDKVAKDKIVNANLRFVVNIAKKYKNSGMEFLDLISEGNIGLLTAIEKFDVSKGYHFISYAVWWIRQAILKSICEKSRSIRLPLNRANEIVQIEKAKKLFNESKSEEEEIREIALMLGMSEKHVRDMILISRDMISLDSQIEGSEGESASIGDFIPDDRYGEPDDSIIKNYLKKDLSNVLETLKPNEAKVIKLRYGLENQKPMSLKQVGEICNLTKERIRQIEKNAITRMQLPSRAKKLKPYVA